MADDKKKVVIIGGGAAGVFTAYLLKKNACDDFDITILEKLDEVGGHTRSYSVSDGLETTNVDLGAQFFSETVQPDYCDMLREEGFFDGIDSPIIERPADVAIWNATNEEMVFRVPDNLSDIFDDIDDNPLDWLNFLILTLAAIEHYTFGDWDLKFGDWLDDIPFLLFKSQREAFKKNIARPLMYQFGLVEPSKLDELSAKFVVFYYVGSLPWEGGEAPFNIYNSKIGLDGVLEKLLAKYGLSVTLNAEVEAITKQGEGYDVKVKNGATHFADEVIFATNPQWTKDLIPAGSEFDAVRDVVTAMDYLTVTVQSQVTDSPLHMPATDWAVSNVLQMDDGNGDPTHYMLSVWFGPVRDEDIAKKCFKSWGSPQLMPQGGTYDNQQTHRLMIGTPDFITLRQTLRASHQGVHHLWFVGGYIVDYDAQNAALKSASLVASELIESCLQQQVAASTQFLIQPLQLERSTIPPFLREPRFGRLPPLFYAIEAKLLRDWGRHEAVLAWWGERYFQAD